MKSRGISAYIYAFVKYVQYVYLVTEYDVLTLFFFEFLKTFFKHVGSHYETVLDVT